MAPFYIFIALLIQSAFVYCDDEDANLTEKSTDFLAYEHDSKEIEPTIPVPILTGMEHNDHHHHNHDAEHKHPNRKDFFDMLFGANFYPSPSATMMAQATNSDKSAEEQLEEIKQMAKQITTAIQNEMANLLSFALIGTEKEKESVDVDSNKMRKRRSVESPMDSTELVMRLLRHIKNNNEYQNIAIEKLMSAQEIADKYGIDFNPDAELLTDLAVAANEQAKEMSDILTQACDTKNQTQVEFVPFNNEQHAQRHHEDPYYVYSVHPEHSSGHPMHPKEFSAGHAHNQPEYHGPHNGHHAHHPPGNNRFPNHPEHHQCRHHQPMETQMMPPPMQQYPPVSQRPNFYEPPMMTPHQEPFNQYCAPFEPIATIVLPMQDIFEPEPELVGEEYEETVSSKVLIEEGDMPGTTTVNHVMTYTLSDKAHFRNPQVERLPEQMLYSFFLM